MSQPKNPQGGATPRARFQASPGQRGPAGTQPGEQINPEDYRNPVVADFLASRLPPGIVYRNGQPEPATTSEPPAPEKVLTADEASRQAADAAYEGLTKSPETFWPSIGRLIQLGLLMDGLDPRAVRLALPFNSAQVRDGGLAVIKATQSDRKAECMEVDVPALGQQVAASLRIGRAREVLEPAFRVVDANETVVLGRIAAIVDQGLTLGESVIKGDGNLSWLLGPALAIRGEPAAAAVTSRVQNARTEEAIRADEQARLLGGAPPEVPVQTTTVSTQTAGSMGPAAPSAAKTAYGAVPKDGVKK